MTNKVKAFVEALRQNPGISYTRAAELAGYENARSVGFKLAEKHKDLVEPALVEGRKALKVGAEEAEQILAEIARDPTHKDRHKAVQDFLKMHGKLSDKLNVVVDRAQLNKQLDELIASMTAARQAENLLDPLAQQAVSNTEQVSNKSSSN